MEKRSLKKPFYYAAMGLYAFGMNAKYLHSLFSIDVYSHMGQYIQSVKYQFNSVGGAITICCLSKQIAEAVVIPKIKPYIKSIAIKSEELAVAFTMAGLTAQELYQSLVPRARFDWQDMADYTLACLATYAIGKYDQKRGVKMFSPNPTDVPPTENTPQ